MIEQLLKDNYGFILDQEVLDVIAKEGVYKKILRGETLIDVGDYIKSMPLLLSGAIKIVRSNEKGNEVLLYFLEIGETCAMSLDCCLKNKKSEIKAIAETDSELLFVPIEKVEGLLLNKSWRNFVFESYTTRFKEMLEVIDSLTFNDLNSRLKAYLKDKAIVTRSKVISITHQSIADDLNTSRVVISRLLKKMELSGKIKLGRNQLELIEF